MHRHGLGDDEWDRIKHLLPGQEGWGGVTCVRGAWADALDHDAFSMACEGQIRGVYLGGCGCSVTAASSPPVTTPKERRICARQGKTRRRAAVFPTASRGGNVSLPISPASIRAQGD
jgi:transposase